MDAGSAILAFSAAAALLTITPGLDTALVLRTAAVEGGRQAMLAGAGVVTGVLAWGLFAALGLGALLTLCETAYTVLRLVGAAYVCWLGLGLIKESVTGGGAAVARASAVDDGDAAVRGARPGEARSPRRLARRGWFWRGLATNLLNPKVGIFYVGFLPQFIPSAAPVVPFAVGLAALHAVMGLVWFAALAWAAHPLGRWLRRAGTVRALDALTGAVLVGFALALAVDRRGTAQP